MNIITLYVLIKFVMYAVNSFKLVELLVNEYVMTTWKEEKKMELKGSKTEKNLMDAFAGESMARNKYTYFASKARKDGFEQIAAIFEETANNEK